MLPLGDKPTQYLWCLGKEKDQRKKLMKTAVVWLHNEGHGVTDHHRLYVKGPQRNQPIILAQFVDNTQKHTANRITKKEKKLILYFLKVLFISSIKYK